MSMYRRQNKNSAFSSAKKNTLKTIWTPGGRLPDMSRLERRPGKKILRFVVIFLIFFALLTAFTWLGLYFTQGKYQEGGIRLEIQGPDEVNNFDEFELLIKYQNNERSPMAMSYLSLRYPQELQISETIPAADDENKTKWSIGTINAEKEGVIILKGKILGRIQSVINLQATLTYKPSNFNSEFQQVKTKEILLKDSPLELTLEAPGEINSGEAMELNLSCRNIAIDKLENLTISLALPPAFLIEKTEPALENNQKLVLNELLPEEEKKIKIKGLFSSDAEGDYDLGFNLSKDFGERSYILKETKQTVKVARNNLALRLFVNERLENQQAKLSDTLQFRIDLDNHGEDTFENVSLTFSAESPLMDWDSLSGINKGKKVNHSLVWDKSNLPSLAKIKAGEKLSFSFQLNLLKSAPPQTDPLIRFSSRVKIGKLNNKEIQAERRSQEIIIKTGSDLRLQAMARYYDDKRRALGSGPLPPEVSKETKYRLVWQINNSYHELTNLKISAVLPDNVRFEGKKTAEAGDLVFNPATRMLEWQINQMPLNIKKLEAQFDVAIVPQENERGNLVLLLGDSLAEATDAVLQSQIVSRAGALNSNLTGDKFAEGKGMVK